MAIWSSWCGPDYISPLPVTPCTPAPLSQLESGDHLPMPISSALHDRKAKNYISWTFPPLPPLQQETSIWFHPFNHKRLTLGLSWGGERQRMRHQFGWCRLGQNQHGSEVPGFQIWRFPVANSGFSVIEETTCFWEQDTVSGSSAWTICPRASLWFLPHSLNHWLPDKSLLP